MHDNIPHIRIGHHFGAAARQSRIARLAWSIAMGTVRVCDRAGSTG